MQTPEKTRFLTVNQVVEEGLYPNIGGLRWLLFNSNANGLESAVRRVGRRLLINESDFCDWLDKQRDSNSLTSS